MDRLLERVRAAGALPWLGAAWLAGPVPGFAAVGVTGQPVGDLWWWHVAAGLLVVAAVVDAVRSGEVATRIDRAVLRAWSAPHRWRTVVVTAWAALAAVAAAQVLDGTASWGHVVTFVAAAAMLAVGPRRVVGGAVIPHLATGAAVLAVMTLGAFALASDALDGPFAYYRVKQQVVVPVAAHNVLAGFLLAGVPAVALAAARRPRRWWPVLVLTGLALAATLSRGALVAGVVAVAVAWLLRDRALTRRVALVVVLGSVGVGIALSSLGAAIPDDDGPTSVVARTELWSAALDAATERPATGVGLDGFLAATQDAELAAPHEHAHALPLHAAATSGLPGLVAAVAVWAGIVVGAWRLLDRDRRAAVLVGMAGLGALALMDEVALRPGTVGLLVLLAVAVAAANELPSSAA